jgi:fructose-1,6-bisphosphatase/inositol monophosphatase family enzyme
MTSRGIVGAAAIGVVVVAVGAGLYIAGRPSEARLRKLDQRRVQDMSVIAGAVESYASQQKHLPASMPDVTWLPQETRRDPVSGQPYEYRATGSSTYELCAAFDRATDLSDEPQRGDRWHHAAGRACFPQTVMLPSTR